MNLQPTTRDAYDLLHQGAVALNRVMTNGMRVDVPYLEHQKRVLERKIRQSEEQFRKSELGRLWRRRYGEKMSMGSDTQLSHLLYKEMGFTSSRKTAKGGDSTNRESLEATGAPGIADLLEWRKLDKTLGTYILGLLKEQTNGVLRPFFHLGAGRGDGDSGGARSYRGSSSAVNFQNLPIRDKEQGKTVRQAILPWPGERILEPDYGGLEVRIACCYHQDPTMVKYLTGQGDMHKDQACQVFLLSPKEVTKDVRFHVKNGWVFAQFYGSYFGLCAPVLWARIDQFDLKTVDGTPLKEHLRKKGIKNYYNFEEHCSSVEKDLWRKKFPIYQSWREEVVERFKKDGYVELKTGFRCLGPMKKNETFNYPVQGAAFHCLLWSFIQLDKISRKEGWKSSLMGQIHDSIEISSPPEENNHVLDTVFRVSQEDIREAWPWIVVPLEVEAEATGVDESWHGKTEVKKTKICHEWNRRTGGGWECLTCGEEHIPF